MLIISTWLGCGSSQSNGGVDNPLKRGLDAEAKVYDPAYFVIDVELPPLNLMQAQAYVFNEKGFLFAHLERSEPMLETCARKVTGPQELEEGIWQYLLEMDGVACAHNLEGDEHRLETIEIQVRCQDGRTPIVAPDSLTTGSSFDSAFQPCGAQQNYFLRASRITRTVIQGEQSETGHSQLSMMMSGDGDFCQVNFRDSLLVVEKCGEYTKLSEVVKINGEPKSTNVLAVRHFTTSKVEVIAAQPFYKSGYIDVRVNNWSGKVNYFKDTPQFSLTDGADSYEGTFTDDLFNQSPNVFK